MTALSIDSPLLPPPGIEGPLSIPPPRPGHPLRWRRLRELILEIRLDKEDAAKVEAGLELFEAVGGLGGEATFRRFQKRPEGRRLLRTRPDLVATLGNRDALAAMPAGSLGRAYLDYAERNGFAADGLVEQNKQIERERDGQDPYREWFWNRFTIAHDLWHVMTGCSTEGEGEMRLLAFSFAQTPQRGYAILLALAAFGRIFEPSFHLDQVHAFRAGLRAHDLVAAPWEQYLTWPLDEVRQCFAVEVLDA